MHYQPFLFSRLQNASEASEESAAVSLAPEELPHGCQSCPVGRLKSKEAKAFYTLLENVMATQDISDKFTERVLFCWMEIA